MDVIPGVSRIGNYIFQERLGDGAFASVWLALHELVHIRVAIKIVQRSSITDEDSVTRLTRELNLLKQMRHPFIAEFYECLEDDQAHYYVMELAENGTLLKYIVLHGALSEGLSRHYFSQLISVLEYLHNDIKVCHRDVKAENLMLDRHNNIRVIDFGLSNQFTTSNPHLNSACGSPPYAPPEMIKGQSYTQAADIWSAGILLYSMATGSLPFEADSLQGLLRKIVTQEVVYPGFLSPQLVDLLRKMLTKSPDGRITIAKIKTHDWFSQTQYEALFAMQLGEQSTEAIVEPEIVDHMTRLGIETATLRQQLLLGTYTELTAMYRMLRRMRLTDEIRDTVEGLAKERSMPKRVMSTVSPEIPPGQTAIKQRGFQRVVTYTPGRQYFAPRVPSPAPAARPTLPVAAAETVKPKGMPVQLTPRRFARPVGLTRMPGPVRHRSSAADDPVE
jgi:serine/threonine protein kinase